MKVKDQVKGFFWDNVGKFALLAGVTAIVAFGTFLGVSKDGIKTAALALGGAAAASAAGASTAVWKIKDYVKEQAEQSESIKSQNENEKTRIVTEIEQKEIEEEKRQENDSTKKEELIHAFNEIKEQNEKSIELQVKHTITNEENHAEIMGMLRGLKEQRDKGSSVKNLGADNPSSVTNPNRLFSENKYEPKPEHKPNPKPEHKPNPKRRYKPKHKQSESFYDLSKKAEYKL